MEDLRGTATFRDRTYEAAPEAHPQQCNRAALYPGTAGAVLLCNGWEVVLCVPQDRDIYA